MQKWYNMLEDMRKKDEKEKMEEMHQHKVAQMIKRLAQNHEANTMDGA